MSKFKLTQTATEVQDILNNSLQKPTGLTKTKLVGVGVNGQENIEIGDNLTLANGKLSATGGSARHGYMVIINDKMHYEIYTTKDYNWKIGEKINISSKLWTDNNYKELRSPGTYPAAGLYNTISPSTNAIVSMIQITESGYRGINMYNVKDDVYFSSSISKNSFDVVKLF